MKIKTTIAICSMPLFIGVLAEETTVLESEAAYMANKLDLYSNTRLNFLIKDASIAGVGRFMNQPSPTNVFAELSVEDLWTGNASNSTVRIAFDISDPMTDWVIPTNVPVVFFAEKSWWKTNTFEHVKRIHSPLDAEEMIQRSLTTNLFHFIKGDRSWFRVTREGGRLYELTTNVWDFHRGNPNPNPTNHYVYLCSVADIQFEESPRVWWETIYAIYAFLDRTSDAFMLEKLHESDLPDRIGSSIRFELRNRGWTETNGVWNPPPPK